MPAPGRRSGAAPAGGCPARAGIWPPLIETLRQWARAEAGAGRLLPWVPVAFGTGIAFYFAADHEPVLSVAAIVAIALCAAAFVIAAAEALCRVAVMIAAVAAALPSPPGKPRGSPMACWRGRCIRWR